MSGNEMITNYGISIPFINVKNIYPRYIIHVITFLIILVFLNDVKMPKVFIILMIFIMSYLLPALNFNLSETYIGNFANRLSIVFIFISAYFATKYENKVLSLFKIMGLVMVIQVIWPFIIIDYDYLSLPYKSFM